MLDRLRQRLHDLLTPQSVLEAHEERALAAKEGTVPIAQTANRQPARVSGVIRSLAISPRGSGAAVEVDLYDGTGAVTVVWLGQRQILGMEPGRHVIVDGLMTIEDNGQRIMRDPRYELIPWAVGK
ncbi:MAG: OB-fold nucleic acid binding domain-containing protein [Bifidobacteriaceae bacterium]|jgi:cytochrome c-type biogenesis protein CcmE|nr:OB-fold nucleic acid binding domain-containing protein [Bifidobacteriaceae bacterium]